MTCKECTDFANMSRIFLATCNARIFCVTKDAQLAFRVTSELKTQLEAIAAKEGRSVAQVCEAFLKAGTEQYRREGNKALQKQLQRSAE